MKKIFLITIIILNIKYINAQLLIRYADDINPALPFNYNTSGSGQRPLNSVLLISNGRATIGFPFSTLLARLTANTVFGEGLTTLGQNAGSFLNYNISDTYIGANAGENSSGTTANTFIGRSAGHFISSVTTGLATVNAGLGLAPGSLNTFVGASAGSGNGTNTSFLTANRNSFFGASCAFNITAASRNSGFGHNALASLSTGNDNIAIGQNTATALNSGNQNVIIGRNAGNGLTGGNDNICLGFQSNIGATNNNTIAIGSNAIITQSNSMLLGAVNGTGITNGTYMHVGINTNTPGTLVVNQGRAAQFHIFNSNEATEADPLVTADGATNTNATTHARIRFETLPLNTTLNQVVVINPTTGKLYRRVFPTNSGCATGNFVPKQDPANPTQQICSQIFDDATSVGIGWFAPGGPPANFAQYTKDPNVNYFQAGTVPCSGTPCVGTAKLRVLGVTWSDGFFSPSDARLKKNINPITGIKSLELIKRLNGKSYLWNQDAASKDRKFDIGLQIGFIAQEVEKVFPEAVVKDAEGYYAMNYTMLIPVLTEAMKEQQKMIETQQKLVEQQQKEIEELKALVKGTTPKAVLENPAKTIQLFQNVPNPFSKETDIKFYLPETVKQANLTIYDMQGKQLRKIDIIERNEANIKINAKELPAGMYMYSLIADGKEMDTKRMILTDY